MDQKLSESLQDYLKIILTLINQKVVARTKDIAKIKKVSMPSTTEAIKKLSKAGYVKYSAREFINLTPKGKQVAVYLANRNIFLQNFLQDILELDEANASQEACALEHHLSGDTLERLSLLYQFLTQCPLQKQPCVDNFKNCLKKYNSEENTSSENHDCFIGQQFPHIQPENNTVHILLSSMKEGQAGTLLLLSPNSRVTSKLIKKGFIPGSKILLEKKGYSTFPYIIKVNSLSIEVDPEFADSIEIAIERNKDSKENILSGIFPLSYLSADSEFRIVKIKAKGEIRRRLLDIGFIKGQKGHVVREALLRDPIEININGTNISLRRSEAKLIDIEVLN